MSVSGVLLGLINIALVAALLILVGLAVVWFCNLVGVSPPPEQMRKVYLVIVGLVCLGMFVALIFGHPVTLVRLW